LVWWHLAFNVPKLEPAIESLLADGIQSDSKHIPGCVSSSFVIPGESIEFLKGYRDEAWVTVWFGPNLWQIQVHWINVWEGD
jgi:hypothetical protein